MTPKSWKVWAAVGLLRAIGRTLRFQREGEERVAGLKQGGTPVLYAFFHGSQFPLVCGHRDRNICIMTSLSRDGEFQKQVLSRLGYQVVRGSSSRGGMRGFLEMKRMVSRGWDAGIAVDGPRGPRFQVKPGIVLLAKMTGTPIIPVGVGIGRAICFRKSWDQYLLPVPFSKVVFRYGDPLTVKDDQEGIEKDLERILLSLTDEAGRRVRGL